MNTLQEIFYSKPVLAICLGVVIFAYVGAVAASFAVPISAGYWGPVFLLVPAVAVAGPSYYRAAKWLLNKLQNNS